MIDRTHPRSRRRRAGLLREAAGGQRRSAAGATLGAAQQDGRGLRRHKGARASAAASPPQNPLQRRAPKRAPCTPPARAAAPRHAGIKFTELGQGSGEAPRVGDLVMCDVVLALEDGTTILDTRAAGERAPRRAWHEPGGPRPAGGRAGPWAAAAAA